VDRAEWCGKMVLCHRTSNLVGPALAL